ncbi:hypothetical protein [Candidatus Anaplasma sp. TIGMIC]|uniref:hypothetical protein n=1 Tax=Candidatus Anaplasma sp. TIGMIC TaxID=3020713 RepID=UPI00232ECFE8|nr:hypothetical protein [Candidatus Anaplasma sp. TIGMIC]MDB1135272.1 hypothetical protein [Candidatus Anaplasma sp. TIGMIC]
MFQNVRGFDAVLLSFFVFVATSLMKLFVSIGLIIKGPAKAIEKGSIVDSASDQKTRCTSTEKVMPDTSLQIPDSSKFVEGSSQVCTLLEDAIPQVCSSTTLAK